MDLSLPYGSEHVSVRVRKHCHILGRTSRASSHNAQDQIVRDAMEHPLQAPRLADAVRAGDRVAIVVSDYTRPTGADVYAPMILSQLMEAGVAAENIVIVIALGLHRPASDQEIASILGPQIPEQVRVENHNPDQGLVDLGGVQMNRAVAEASLVVITGAVTFHPMAGYSGGYKSLVPGVASRQDILHNHLLYFQGDHANPRVGPAIVERNPVIDDIRRRGQALGRTVCLNVVMDEQHRVAFAAYGSVDSAWYACASFLRHSSIIDIPKRLPVVFASAGGFPCDFSFYQSMKTLTNSALACEPGGTLIVLSECRNGWELRDELIGMFSLPLKEIARQVKSDFRMDALAVYMAARVIKSRCVFLFSSLPADQVRRAGMEPVNSPTELERIIDMLPTCEIAVFPEATSFLPAWPGFS